MIRSCLARHNYKVRNNFCDRYGQALDWGDKK